MKLETLGWVTWILAWFSLVIDGLVGWFYWGSLLTLTITLWFAKVNKKE